jgi:hypothetical protein
VSGGAQPFTVNSTRKVGNLNADLLDGHNAASFQPKSGSVGIYAPQMLIGSERTWNVGAYFTLNVSCYHTADGTNHIDQSVLNNAPGTGEWVLGDLVGVGTNPATPRVNGDVILSGDEERIDQATYPVSSKLVGDSSFDTLIWRDDGGETITGAYHAVVFTSYCSIVGSLTRTT